MDVKKLRGLLVLALTLLSLQAEGMVLRGRALGPMMTPTAVITVNSEGDEGDAFTDDGICDTTGDPTTTPPTPYSGICTLRAAIQTADENSGPDTINFSGALTIQPATALPAIWSEPTTVDGGGVVTIDGSSISGSSAGLAFYGGGNHTITGLTIRGFGGSGIVVFDDIGGSTISDNELRGNGKGINIASDTPNNTIENNLVVENTTGIWISSDGNTIKGNKIGTDGTQDLGNSGDGIYLSLVSNNQIGGDTGISVGGSCTGDCNLISGNGGDGIVIAQGTDPSTGVLNIVQGNFIGANQAGTAAIPNDSDGIETNGDNNQFIGNLISGNSDHGINLIPGANNNIVRGNLIGTKVNGTEALGNGGGGVNMEYANGNVIGGDSGAPLPSVCEDYCNLISANSAGITITQAINGGSNSIIGNFIGTDVNGTARLSNRGNGVWSQGLNMSIASNLISGNLGDGVHIYGVFYGSSDVNTTTVQANLIGTARNGETDDLGNRGHGVFVYKSSGNSIGGAQDGEGNTIAGNYKAGVVISNSIGGGAVNNRILRNSIHSNGGRSGLGIDLNGDGVTENDLGDADDMCPNNLQNFPVITGLKGKVISGTLNSTPNTTFRLEFFVNSECSNSGYGQGETFLGSFDVTTDGNGDATFGGTLDTAPGAQPVAATATDPDGNTSEFSACFGGLVVNSINDRSDANTLDAACDTGQTIAGGDPECTLRAAIEQANFLPGRNTITFDIPDWSSTPIIYPGSALPAIAEPVVINGTTQKGGWVELSGLYAGDNVSGLDILGGNSRVQGLIIGQFDGHGILLRIAGGNVIVGNLIGTTADDRWVGNGRNGIRIQSSANNTIGGTTAAERNVISNNGWRTNASGIYVEFFSTGNVIQGNMIGTNPNGNTAAGNTWAGVYIEDVSGNTVGGMAGVSLNECTGACNLISGNKYGIVLKSSQAISNTVQGNFIGTDRTGTVALGNTSYGIVVDGAPHNLIGGTSSAARNLISGNGTAGGEGDGVIIGNATATGNKVQGNAIGAKTNGMEVLPNARNGVRIDNAPNNVIGGAHGANLISGNTGNGVEIVGAGATGNSVQANLIGTTSSGTGALPNGGSGVVINSAPNNTVGGTALGNLILGNTGNGVEIVGADATGNTVQANLIGTTSSGTVVLPNGGSGVFINGAPGNIVGGSVAGQGNVLSGNGGSGLKIAGDGADGNVVQGNFIGTDESGAAVLPNGGDGVLLGEDASGTQVGGAGEGEGNVISGNGSNGVAINGLGAVNNVVQGNFIGTLKDGITRVANTAHGVYIAGGANSNTIGGVFTSMANVIVFNGGDGVYVASGNSNAIRRNVIHSNTGLGIDLGTNGVTPNDVGDGDSGANTLQNFPAVTSLGISGGVATIEGTLDSAATVTYTLEFFANTGCDASLHGEGERFLGTITVNTDAGGHADFTFTPSAPVSDTEKVTATATDANGNTSEFSRCARHTERVVIDPAVGYTLVFTDTQGNPVIVEIPAGAITYTEAITLAYALIEDEVSGPAGFAFGNHAFELSAYVDHTLLSGLAFFKPVTITIHYSDADIAGLGEDELTLLYWNGAVWADDGIDVVERNPADNYVIFAIAHLSDFALFAPQDLIYLPLILR
jgi:CSLREA domain-containing protein